jgi:hypothetical protein
VNAVVKTPTLAEQRAQLRQQLAAGRAAIAARIDPPEEEGGTYPRSRTMRFLSEHSGLMMQVAAGLLGGKVISSMTRTLAIARVLRSMISR